MKGAYPLPCPLVAMTSSLCHPVFSAPCDYAVANFVSLGLASNWADSLRSVATSTPSLTRRSPFTLLVHPFTLVRPQGLAAFLHRSFPDGGPSGDHPFLAGHVTDAVSDLSSMGQAPKPAHE